MKKEQATQILGALISKGFQLASEMEADQYDIAGALERRGVGFNVECLQSIVSIIGKDSSVYSNFLATTNRARINHLTVFRGIEILKALNNIVDNGLVEDIKAIISREFFGEISDAAKDMLSKGYKTGAAVMMGVALEQRLRQLCQKAGLPTTDGALKPLTANPLNVSLYKSNSYNLVIHNQVNAWLSVRNAAAHGRESEFTDNDVDLMIDGIKNFLDTYAAV